MVAHVARHYAEHGFLAWVGVVGDYHLSAAAAMNRRTLDLQRLGGAREVGRDGSFWGHAVAGKVAAVALEWVEISVGFHSSADNLRNVPLLRLEHGDMGGDCAQEDCEG